VPQLLLPVTLTVELLADEPAPSMAETAKVKVVAEQRPFTVKLVPPALPIELPFSKTV
jgi:hypothetical protein